jgi:hypothetical protein
MRTPKALTPYLALAAAVASLAPIGCADDHSDKPILGPSTLVLRLSPEMGPMDRPAVAFDHGKHTDALGKDACKTCHATRQSGTLGFDRIASLASSPKEAMNAYHDACLTCHKDRASAGEKTGPVTCGGCHAHVEGSSLERANLRFDYGLHYRHDKAENGKCETCHHVWDEAQGKLVPKKGEESACRDCHGPKDEGRVLSLQRASHDSCINCHAQRDAKGDNSGPTLCVGCHDAEQLAAIKPVDKVPRMDRGQPDMTWIRAEGATAAFVPFDHAAHESTGSSCSSCHHKTLRACKECHTVAGKPEGGLVPLERAYHDPSSTHSCVGCHRNETRQANCAGCHHDLPAGPGVASCTTCHAGPPVGTQAAALPQPALAGVELAGLPPTSAAFPDEVKMEYMPGGEYGPANLPHRKIVERLDRVARADKLAARFHSKVETLCAGCHHRTPVGARPPKCVSCHPADHDPSRDRPGLKSALHRQCILCHQQMEVKAGCVDCHAETKEQKQ